MPFHMKDGAASNVTSFVERIQKLKKFHEKDGVLADYSERSFVRYPVLVLFFCTIIFAFLGLKYPSSVFAASEIGLMLLFGTLTMVAFIFLLACHRYQFYDDYLTVDDGFLNVSRIYYKEIVFCRPAKNLALTGKSIQKFDWMKGPVSIFELKVLFRNSTITVRSNPMLSGSNMDLYTFINQKIWSFNREEMRYSKTI